MRLIEAFEANRSPKPGEPRKTQSDAKLIRQERMLPGTKKIGPVSIRRAHVVLPTSPDLMKNKAVTLAPLT